MRTLGRRDFLTAGALAAGGALLTSRLAFARTNTASRSRVVFVILRGALDGLAVVPPCGDPAYAGLRRELALGAPGSAGGALPLNGFFGLHPSLVFLQESYSARELIVIHAVASPYRERSHFDGQDVLENGTVKPHALQTGWLNRALATLQSGHRVWVVGHMEIPEPGTPLPGDLPPPPLEHSGWSDLPYSGRWAAQAATFLENHSRQFERVDHETNSNVRSYEDLQLFETSGWKDSSLKTNKP